ncbi:hypothetical protein WS58_13295 [Burkholderia pseudomultivorans]|nr:hypothetical protein WS57_28955 [Burkholderia pseudomultivorans]KVC45783.1 hypothetical protein WS58_13295 [Burkholderia pseudomultivorans]KVG63662.1 hypothetical protein WS80_20730 [Burkholderia pseudomultivorans]
MLIPLRWDLIQRCLLMSLLCFQCFARQEFPPGIIDNMLRRVPIVSHRVQAHNIANRFIAVLVVVVDHDRLLMMGRIARHQRTFIGRQYARFWLDLLVG